MVHELYLRPFRCFKKFVQNPFKKCVFGHFLSNKGMIISFFRRNYYHMKKEEIIQLGIALLLLLLFNNVL